MGGGHHDFGEKFKIPDYRIYKVEDAPKLVQLRDILAQKGLKDPWIRNEVWRYNGQFGSVRQRTLDFFFRGFKYGFAAFLVTIGIEAALDKMSPKKDSSHH